MESIVSYLTDLTKSSSEYLVDSVSLLADLAARIDIRWELSTLAFPSIKSAAISSESENDGP